MAHSTITDDMKKMVEMMEKVLENGALALKLFSCGFYSLTVNDI